MAPVSTAEETRNRILAFAFQEFYRNGFQGSSLNQIVELARTTKGALFHHFKSKQELGYAVVGEVIQPEMRRSWLEPMDQSLDPIHDLKSILNGCVKHDKERICQGCPLNNLAQEMSPLDEIFRKKIESLYNDWRKSVSNAFARGIKAGNVKSTANPEAIGAFLVAALAGIIGTVKNAQDPDLFSTCGEALFDYLNSLKP
ncbi:MAG: TetR/AcrR family transcriptional regulator [Verrucomicrobia bacterium]|jgi:TetR/AcrR family transcriptional regulator, transcriptional repressor for nem operon|nr:TetR/AcrR family transcriptional regulator [Verrucomicrobiota bacterium]